MYQQQLPCVIMFCSHHTALQWHLLAAVEYMLLCCRFFKPQSWVGGDVKVPLITQSISRQGRTRSISRPAAILWRRYIGPVCCCPVLRANSQPGNPHGPASIYLVFNKTFYLRRNIVRKAKERKARVCRQEREAPLDPPTQQLGHRPHASTVITPQPHWKDFIWVFTLHSRKWCAIIFSNRYGEYPGGYSQNTAFSLIKKEKEVVGKLPRFQDLLDPAAWVHSLRLPKRECIRHRANPCNFTAIKKLF